MQCLFIQWPKALAATLAMLMVFSGCGVMKSRSATEHLLMSDAVDHAISQIDFRVLAGSDVYLDTQYIRSVKGVGFVNSDYIISGLRQHLTAANCRIQEDPEDAQFVVEPRIGALGSDDHELNYGVPASGGALASATSLFSTGSPVPAAFPEISLAKRNDYRAAAKLAVFAYHRETRRPVWQSGLSKGQSEAHATWILGAGPFEKGSIYKATRFAGAPIRVPYFGEIGGSETSPSDSYYQAQVFDPPRPEFDPGPPPIDGVPRDNQPGAQVPYLAENPDSGRLPDDSSSEESGNSRQPEDSPSVSP